MIQMIIALHKCTLFRLCLERAVAALRQAENVPDQLLAHLSPLGWEHVNLTGDYIWSAERRPRKTVTDSARSGPRPIPLARPPEFMVCPLMREIQAFRYFWPRGCAMIQNANTPTVLR
jgi:hypothetical protein